MDMWNEIKLIQVPAQLDYFLHGSRLGPGSDRSQLCLAYLIQLAHLLSQLIEFLRKFVFQIQGTADFTGQIVVHYKEVDITSLGNPRSG